MTKMCMTNEELTAVVSNVAKAYGYKDVQAEFQAFKEFRIRWSRTYTWISMEVSDYLNTAPKKVLHSLLDTLFQKIKGQEDTTYADDVCEWLCSEEFLEENQQRYASRCRGLSKGTAGSARDLAECVRKLEDEGLVAHDPALLIGWEPRYRTRKTGSCSALMKVVTIPGYMDDESFPEDILDYVVFRHLAHMSMGFNPDNSYRGAEYDDLLRRYPGRRELEKRMSVMNLEYRRCPRGANTPLHGTAMTPLSGH